jgi:hypothetical protein
MFPVEEAAQVCRGAGYEFREVLEAHLLNGFVFSTPDAFLAGRPVPKGADMSDLWCSWPDEVCNAWFVWLAAGDAWRLIDLTPYPLPWVGWHRTGRDWSDNHWLPFAVVQRRLHWHTAHLANIHSTLS